MGLPSAVGRHSIGQRAFSVRCNHEGNDSVAVRDLLTRSAKAETHAGRARRQIPMVLCVATVLRSATPPKFRTGDSKKESYSSRSPICGSSGGGYGH